MVNFCDRDANLIVRNKDIIKEKIMQLLSTDTVFIDSISKNTGTTDRLKYRCKAIYDILDEVEKNDKKYPRCYSFEFKKELYDKNCICEICGNKISNIDDAQVDHIELYSKGGPTTPENARLVHRYCNQARAKK